MEVTSPYKFIGFAPGGLFWVRLGPDGLGSLSGGSPSDDAKPQAEVPVSFDTSPYALLCIVWLSGSLATRYSDFSVFHDFGADCRPNLAPKPL